jgi:predicted ATPase
MIPRIRLVQIKNYKSLAAVSVELEPFTVFVGPNGSGKSNFFDALAFVQECLSESVEMALRHRGGIEAVLGKYRDRIQSDRNSLEWDLPPINMGVRLVMDFDEGLSADYGFEIERRSWDTFQVARERCLVRKGSGNTIHFEVKDGLFLRKLPGVNPVVLSDRLQLPLLAGIKDLRPLWDFLRAMRVYAIRPESIRELQIPDSGEFLKPDGSNAAAVLRRIGHFVPPQPNVLGTITRLLSLVAKGITGVFNQPAGAKETVSFEQDIGSPKPVVFDALNMSDGTLRVLGLLLAVFQPLPKVVGIEEPEATVHPAIAEMIMEVLKDASDEKQVLITTHSPDLLDQKELKDHQIRVVALRNGRTVIAPMSQGDRQAIRERLYTPGELLRIGELSADKTIVSDASEEIDLFGEPFPDLDGER